MQELVVGKRVASTKRGTQKIGEQLAQLRQARGMTQTELAKALGTSQPLVSKYERGELHLHAELIAELTRILGVSADELIGAKQRKTPTTDALGSVSDKRLLKRFQAASELPKRDRDAIVRTIDAYLR